MKRPLKQPPKRGSDFCPGGRKGALTRPIKRPLKLGRHIGTKPLKVGALTRPLKRSVPCACDPSAWPGALTWSMKRSTFPCCLVLSSFFCHWRRLWFVVLLVEARRLGHHEPIDGDNLVIQTIKNSQLARASQSAWSALSNLGGRFSRALHPSKHAPGSVPTTDAVRDPAVNDAPLRVAIGLWNVRQIVDAWQLKAPWRRQGIGALAADLTVMLERGDLDSAKLQVFGGARLLFEYEARFPSTSEVEHIELPMLPHGAATHCRLTVGPSRRIEEYRDQLQGQWGGFRKRKSEAAEPASPNPNGPASHFQLPGTHVSCKGRCVYCDRPKCDFQRRAGVGLRAITRRGCA